jgi:leucyl aminopeptidase (aminopeptidase T)
MPDLGPAVDTVLRCCPAVTRGEGLRPRWRRRSAPATCSSFAPTTRLLSHTRARKAASDAGATMPGVTDDMSARVMAVDFDLMSERSQAVAQLLDAADSARGAPVASSIARLGLTTEQPARLTVSDGRLAAAEGRLGPELLAQLNRHGELGTNVAELGVGTNDRARLTGFVLEDEKMLGTVHVAFGGSAGIGGTVSVPIHLDVVVLDASLTVGGREVLVDGRYAHDT